MVLAESFYRRADVVLIAKELLGKLLITNVDGNITSGIIVETEAYAGVTDKASHAFGARRTKRTEIMYSPGGVAYVYLCYGIHHLFNVVTGEQDTPHAVLIRAVEPVTGVDIMLQRRKKQRLLPALTAGPGAMSEALGIKTSHSGVSLQGSSIFIEDKGVAVRASEITAGPRIGVGYAQEDALLPYRFYIKGNKFVSKPKNG